MAYRIAGVDVHKKMLAVVVSDVEVEGEYQFERRTFGSNPEQLRSLAAWLLEQEVGEVVNGVLHTVYVRRIIRRIRSEFTFPGSICNLTRRPPVIPSHQHRLVHSAHAVPGTGHRRLFLVLNIGDQHFGS